ncbi:hypothetical protein [Mycolicibacterium alvei]|uniref:Secreted protein n=1 Tax=Mycolicibacterium alvei TaxID=67081 RepID=A0A6N4UJQ9_9MYCO|nr:hypothetical protein MALV_01750 [Mycolicibacterium alvei]
MTFKRMAAAAVLTIAAATGLGMGSASPAHAEPVMQGVFNYTQEGVGHETWSIYPSCVPTVGDLREPLELAVACRLHVATTRGTKGGDARLTGGQWVYSTAVPDGLQCANGDLEPTKETYKFDDVTLTGTRSVSNNEACGGTLAPAIHTFPFTLKYERPLPIPVDVYPLDCQSWGLRLCI